jgi:ABC-2 type transport system ATP-binding protein
MIAKIKGVKLTEEIFKWLKKINLTDFLNLEFSKMSFGTRRKITLSACLIANPKVLLLDEPFNGLDVNTAKCLKNWIIESKQTKCILIASHDSNIVNEEYDSILNV